MLKTIIKCKNPKCSNIITNSEYDTLGRRKGRVSEFCCKACCDAYFKITHPDYFSNYYLKNKNGEVK